MASSKTTSGFDLKGEKNFKVHGEEACSDLRALSSKTVAILGYGNQGRAQALNLRDSGVNVIVGNRNDEYRDAALADGFPTFDIPTAAAKGDVLLVLTTDESQPEIWDDQILPGVRPGDTLCWASGYNVAYGLLDIPKNVDAIMVAPRMMGSVVRDLFLKGKGAMTEVGVHQDSSGRAMSTALALCKGMGLLRGGAIEATFEGETALDLFAEQVYMPVLTHWIQTCYELGVEFGFCPEKMVLELYASTEMAQIFHLMAKNGCFKQMSHHSTTSQYGTFTRAKSYFTPDVERHFRKTAAAVFSKDITGGAFVGEWTNGGKAAEDRLANLVREKLEHPMSEAEDRVLERMRRLTAVTAAGTSEKKKGASSWFTWQSFVLGVGAGIAAAAVALTSRKR